MQQLLCMFCGGEVSPDQATMEHFVPKSLWEKGYRPKGTKTLPAHKECNNSFSDDNEYFRDVMVMEDGVERHPVARRVQQGAIHRKFAERFGSIVKTLKNLGLRRVHTPSGIYVGNHPTFEVDWPRIERVLCNVLKGVFYVTQQRPLPREFVISVSDVRVLNRDWVDKVISFMVPWQSFGDSAFGCRYVVSSRQPIEKITCLMQFYEKRLFLAEAITPELLGANGNLFVPANKESAIVIPRWSMDRSKR